VKLPDPIEIDALDRPLWGAEAMAPIIGKTVEQTSHLLWKKRIDADKFGSQWVSTPRRLLKMFAGHAAKQAVPAHP
jgi:hypothetical protein